MNTRGLAIIALCVSGMIIYALLALAGERRMNTSTNQPQKKTHDFVMDQKKQMEFFRNLMTLKIGDARTEIIQRLGPPTYDQVGTRKEDNKFIVRSVTYYIKRWDRDLVNEIHDRRVKLYFNQEDLLIGATSNIENYQFDIPNGTVSGGTSIGKFLEKNAQGKK